jgi:hypothetical protein
MSELCFVDHDMLLRPLFLRICCETFLLLLTEHPTRFCFQQIESPKYHLPSYFDQGWDYIAIVEQGCHILVA